MKAEITSVLVLALTLGAGQEASAGPCDYRPSRLAAEGASAAGSTVKALGAFTLTNAATGGTMLGASSASAGAGAAAGTTAGAGAAGGGSAAGGAGLAGSVHGALGAAGAALSAPATVVVAAVAAVGIAGYEGLCYFSDKRVTKYGDVLAIMQSMSDNADPGYFRLIPGTPGKKDAVVRMRGASGETESYEVKKLYIVNNMLKYRQLGSDAVVGNIDFVAQSTAALTPMSALKPETTETAPAASPVATTTPDAAPAAASVPAASATAPAPAAATTTPEAAAPAAVPPAAASATTAPAASAAAPAAQP